MRIDESDSALLKSAKCFAESIQFGISIAQENEEDECEAILTAP